MDGQPLLSPYSKCKVLISIMNEVVINISKKPPQIAAPW